MGAHALGDCSRAAAAAKEPDEFSVARLDTLVPVLIGGIQQFTDVLGQLGMIAHHVVSSSCNYRVVAVHIPERLIILTGLPLPLNSAACGSY